MSFEDIRALAHPCCATACSRTSTPQSEGRHDRLASIDQLLECRAGAQRVGHVERSIGSTDSHAPFPAHGSSIRRCSRGSATSSCSRGRVVDGFINGLHQSPYFGASLDFAEHRGYVPGDDIRRIDWRLYARTDRFYVKQYEADSNANFAVLLDISKSMRFGSRGISKLDYAKYLAACLTYFAHRQRDRVGLVTFDDDIVDSRAAARRSTSTSCCTRSIARRPGGPGSLERPLQKMAEHFGRRGILVIDLRPLRGAGGRPRCAEAAALSRPRSHRVSHPRSGGGRLPVRGRRRAFEDLESGEQMPVVPDGARPTSIARSSRQHIDGADDAFTQNRIDYALFNTSMPLDYALFSYLSARENA